MSRRVVRVFFARNGGWSNASARTRVFAYLPYLLAHAIHAHVASYPFHRFHPDRPHTLRSKLWLELLPLRSSFAFLRADTVFFQRNNFTTRAVTWAKRLGKRVVYDLDDAIYVVPPDSHGVDEYTPSLNPELAERVNWMLAQADCVLVSGAELFKYVAERAREVRLLPSVVPEVASRPSCPHDPPVIGWVGAPENQRYVRAVETALLRLQEEWPELEVWLMTRSLMEPPPRFRHRFIPWRLTDERDVVPQFTVGIAPLADNAWCRAKMNFKAAVYLSHGVPAVISPIGFPGEALTAGAVSGAVTLDDWYEQLKQLVADPALRDAMARKGLNFVGQYCSAAARAAEFAEALRPTAGS